MVRDQGVLSVLRVFFLFLEKRSKEVLSALDYLCFLVELFVDPLFDIVFHDLIQLFRCVHRTTLELLTVDVEIY